MIAIKEHTELVRYDASSHKRSYGVLRHYHIYIGGQCVGKVSGKHVLSNALMRLRALVTRSGA